MALVIAGERSGVGKTTLTLAILAALRSWGLQVQSFKVGPDYIDPMFHTWITARPCRSLDPILTSPTYLTECLLTHSRDVDYSLVEGVMGLFDGVGGTLRGSTAAIACQLGLPVVLVIDCARLSGSVAALVHGYRSYEPRLELAGVILNRVGSDRHQRFLRAALATLGVPVLGVVPQTAEITIPDRHLGLVPAAELPRREALKGRLAHLGQTCLDWQQLWPLLRVAPTGSHLANSGITALDRELLPKEIFPKEIFPRESLSREPLPPAMTPTVRLAVAQDLAFNFYYPDNLELLVQSGAEIVAWSPCADPRLPAGVQGLYLGGGYPELFAEALADNRTAQQAVAQAILAGMPTYAECGGLMYLCQTLTDLQGQTWPMVGAIPTGVKMAARLTLGYRQAKVLQSTPLLPKSSLVRGHEFHHSQLFQTPDHPVFALTDYHQLLDQDGSDSSENLFAAPSSDSSPGSPQATPTLEGWQIHQLHASYLHLHWGAHPEIPRRFVARCRQWVAPGSA